MFVVGVKILEMYLASLYVGLSLKDTIGLIGFYGLWVFMVA